MPPDLYLLIDPPLFTHNTVITPHLGQVLNYQVKMMGPTLPWEKDYAEQIRGTANENSAFV